MFDSNRQKQTFPAASSCRVLKTRPADEQQLEASVRDGSRERIRNSAARETLVNKRGSRAAKRGTGLRGRMHYRGGFVVPFGIPGLVHLLYPRTRASRSSIDPTVSVAKTLPLYKETHYGRVVIIRHCRVMIRECVRPLLSVLPPSSSSPAPKVAVDRRRASWKTIPPDARSSTSWRTRSRSGVKGWPALAINSSLRETKIRAPTMPTIREQST